MAAEHGTSGSAGRLPHLDAIQPLFGKHDVSSVRAYTDNNAATGANAMGAEAFAVGDQVAFGGSPTLHTAAHEAAHVVQQRAGVALKGGVGEVGDTYERHADAVADMVVRGESAESLLDQMAGCGGGERAVQRTPGVMRPDPERLRVAAGHDHQSERLDQRVFSGRLPSAAMSIVGLRAWARIARTRTGVRSGRWGDGGSCDAAPANGWG